jgi:hypothetical protein
LLPPTDDTIIIQPLVHKMFKHGLKLDGTEEELMFEQVLFLLVVVGLSMQERQNKLTRFMVSEAFVYAFRAFGFDDKVARVVAYKGIDKMVSLKHYEKYATFLGTDLLISPGFCDQLHSTYFEKH